MKQEQNNAPQGNPNIQHQNPSIQLPKGGGALQSLGEKFQANPVTGTASFSLPVKVSAGRGLSPQMALAYDSGQGNTSFGFGWNIGTPSISRKTQKTLPSYRDEEDTFMLAGAEDLMPKENGFSVEVFESKNYDVQEYLPRTEGGFARIEYWKEQNGSHSFWKIRTADNNVQFYGLRANNNPSVLADPSAPEKVYRWFLELSYTPHGDAMEYHYKAEDRANVSNSIFEANKTLSTNTYLKEICYGNSEMYDHPNGLPATNDWHFRVVVDYGEHTNNSTTEDQTWPVREDAFSSFRSGFEIRNYRLCKRILMFHYFPGAPAPDYANINTLPDENILVGETIIRHSTGKDYNFVEAISYKAHAYGESLDTPEILFEYTEADVDTTLHQWDEKLERLFPAGIDGQQIRFTDLYGEGIQGLLVNDSNQWYYRHNVSTSKTDDEDGQLAFGELLSVQKKPSIGSGNTLSDLDGDGLLDMVLRNSGLNGFYGKDENGEWERMQYFQQLPNINWNDPNLRFVDLNGDGFADILISEHDCFSWYPSLAKKGFGEKQTVLKTLDENAGPNLVFADHYNSVYLADLSGDGMTDIVRVKNGSVDYWPGLGFGRFGRKISMSNAPFLDVSDQFDHRRVRLGDVDGSGTTDLIYIAADGVHYFKNLSGNAFSDGFHIPQFPPGDQLANVALTDLFGTGTACLVWSSPAPSNGMHLQYIDLQGSTKAHLLKRIDNQNGAEQIMHYAPSTRYYLEDKAKGQDWVTKLPFPVQVLAKTETIDHISKHRFVQKSAYHHGYFDPVEREFRGFGMVETWDTENYEDFTKDGVLANAIPEEHMPPVHTKSWFHTGYYHQGAKIAGQYEKEYFQNPDSNFIAGNWTLPDSSIPENLTPEHKIQAARMLKGQLLRQEVYALDDSQVAEYPYAVNEKRYEVAFVEHKEGNEYAIFRMNEAETLSLHYERNIADPRISHQIMQSNAYGQVTKVMGIAYPRLASTTHIEQQKLHITLAETDYINVPGNNTNDYRYLGVPYDKRSYELHHQLANVTALLSKTSLWNMATTAVEIAYDASPSNVLEKRLLDRIRNQFYNETLTAGLPFGQLASHAVAYKNYQAIFSDALLASTFQKDGSALAVNPATQHYIKLDDNSHADDLWYVQSGVQEIIPTAFYNIKSSTDIFGTSTQYAYDSFGMFVERVTAPYGNISTSKTDYIHLMSWESTDPNGNRTQVQADAFGQVIRTAIMGRVGTNEGDTLSNPTSKTFYDIFNWKNRNKPNYVKAEVREIHHNSAGGSTSPWQVSYEYFDGLGRTIMQKVQAEDGEAPLRDANGEIELLSNGKPKMANSTNRWVGNGRTIFNNKGKPVKQYDPYFSSSFEYEDESELVETGTSPIIHYDPLGRAIRTDLPDGTFTMDQFTPWEHISYDACDTVKDSDWYQELIVMNPASISYYSANLSAPHHNTPARVHLDSLGRVFLSQKDSGTENAHHYIDTKSIMDLKGNVLAMEVSGKMGETKTQETRTISETVYSMLSPIPQEEEAVPDILYSNVNDSGRSWSFKDGALRPYDSWSETDLMRSEYDDLHRPTKAILNPGASQKIVGMQFYGDNFGISNPENQQLRGKTIRSFDGAGMTVAELYDFKGNPLRTHLELTTDYTSFPNWAAIANASDAASLNTALSNAGLLSTETDHILVSLQEYDALNRPTRMTQADNSVLTPTYNKAAFLEKLDLNHRGSTTADTLVSNIEYNVHGMRISARYGNNTSVNHTYNETTWRLIRNLVTRHSDAQIMQDLRFYYDAVGNIIQLDDKSRNTEYHSNQSLHPTTGYRYDALYRLRQAFGREQVGLTYDQNDQNAYIPSSPANVIQSYRQIYEYDDIDNMIKRYHYGGSSYTSIRNNYNSGSNQMKGYNNTLMYQYDNQGRMTRMPHLQTMHWNYASQLQRVDMANGNVAFYQYDGGGNRVRKVVRKGSITEERIYAGAYEIFRKSTTSGLQFRRETLMLSDDSGKIAHYETKTHENGNVLGTPEIGIRYQYSNHLNSASLELDENGQFLTYEEYHPFGTTSYRAAKSASEVSMKRYRYNGKEKDEESGLYYYGARYYAPWMMKWISTDPAGFVDGPNLYAYVRNNPVVLMDPNGMTSSGGDGENNNGGDLSTLFNIAISLSPAGPLYLYHTDPIFREAVNGFVERGIETVVGTIEAIPVVYELHKTLNELYPKTFAVTGDTSQSEAYNDFIYYIFRQIINGVIEDIENIYDQLKSDDPKIRAYATGVLLFELLALVSELDDIRHLRFLKKINLSKLDVHSNFSVFSKSGDIFSGSYKQNFSKNTNGNPLGFNTNADKGVDISAITKKFDNFQCIECADSIVSALKDKGIKGEILEINTNTNKGMSGNIWSDTANTNISTNGRHKAVLVDGKVYDNIHKNGIDYDKWLNDIFSPTGYTVKKTSF